MTTIYLDMDGVLVDFIGGICRLFGWKREELYERWPIGEFNIAPILGVTDDEFWHRIEQCPDFWLNLEPTPDYLEIISICENKAMFPGGIVLMTSPPLGTAAVIQKIQWINKHLLAYYRRFAVTPCKEQFAHFDAVLVDDFDVNVDKFRQAGGKAVLVPRRWNSLHSFAHDSVKAVGAMLETI